MTGHEKEQEFRRTIGLNLALLKLGGVVPIGKGFAGRNAFAFATFAIYSLLSISYAYQFGKNTNDLAIVFESIAMIMSVTLNQIRLMILLWLRGSCHALLTTCESLWSMQKPREKEIVASYIDKAKRLTRFYLVCCVSTILLYVLFALFEHSDRVEGAAENATGGVLALQEGQLHRRLPYTLILEAEESPWFEMLYAFQLLVVFNVGFVCVGVDMIGPLLVLIACGYFDAIRCRIEGLCSIERASASALTRSLRICVIHHRMLLEFCRDIGSLTNLIFLVQLIGSTYNISVIGFKLVENGPDKYKYFSQLSFTTLQLFLCNWPADVLLAKSEAIAYAAYLMPWYRYPGSLRQPANLIMIRGQRPVRLVAGKFVGLSLETFASMISTAASFYAVIRSTN